MKTLPVSDRELNQIVFKNAGVSEPRAISDYFTMEEVIWMLEHGCFSVATMDWLNNTLDGQYVKLGY